MFFSSDGILLVQVLLLLPFPLASLMVLAESGSLKSSVLELRPDSPAALMLVMVCIPALMTKMLE
jgi:hypothetical protein